MTCLANTWASKLSVPSCTHRHNATDTMLLQSIQWPSWIWVVHAQCCAVCSLQISASLISHEGVIGHDVTLRQAKPKLSTGMTRVKSLALDIPSIDFQSEDATQVQLQTSCLCLPTWLVVKLCNIATAVCSIHKRNLDHRLPSIKLCLSASRSCKGYAINSFISVSHVIFHTCRDCVLSSQPHGVIVWNP